MLGAVSCRTPPPPPPLSLRVPLSPCLSLPLSLIPSSFGGTWTRGGTADDDAAAALPRRRAEVEARALVAAPAAAAWRCGGAPGSWPGSCCRSPTWREAASACRTCCDSVSLLSLMCASRARQTSNGVCVRARLRVCSCAYVVCGESARLFTHRSESAMIGLVALQKRARVCVCVRVCVCHNCKCES